MKFLLGLLLCLNLFASLPTQTAWEVRQGSSDVNGGGFVTGSAGTDMSQFNNKNATSCTSCQSATVNISTTDVVAVGTTTLTSATMNGSSAMVGNIIHLNGGTGTLAAAWYQITSFTSNTGGTTTFVVDRAIAAGTGITMNVGGALATLNGLNTALAQTTNIAQTGWVMANSTYSISGAVTFNPNANTKGVSIQVNGYTTIRGDGGLATVQASAGSFTLVTISNNNNLTNMTFRNFTLDCNNQTASIGFAFSANVNSAENLHVENCKGSEAIVMSTSNSIICRNCWVSNQTGGVGITLGNGNITSVAECLWCFVTGGSVNGFLIAPSAVCDHCIAANMTGATTDGFVVTPGSQAQTVIMNSIAYGCGRDGLRFNGDAAAGNLGLTVYNSIFVNNTGIGFDNTGSTGNAAAYNIAGNYNAYFGNSAPRSSTVPVGANDVTLSGDPFQAGASLNFALNSTVGAGALLQGVGFPGTPLTGGTGFLDIGTIQHKAATTGTVGVGFVGP